MKITSSFTHGFTALIPLTVILSSIYAQTAPTANNPPHVFHADGTPAGLSELPPSLAAKLKNAGGNSASPRSLPDDEQAVSNAKALANANDLAAAEQAITRSNQAKPNTAAWHLESAHRLLETARQLAHEGNPSSAWGLAKLSLQHLDQVAALTKDDKIKAQAKAQAAFIHLRYSGDATSAITDYTAALQLDPTDRGSQEALARLKTAEANLLARVKQNHL